MQRLPPAFTLERTMTIKIVPNDKGNPPGKLADAELQARQADPYLSPLERTVIGHRAARLAAEIEWHEALIAELPALLAAEAER